MAFYFDIIFPFHTESLGLILILYEIQALLVQSKQKYINSNNNIPSFKKPHML